MVVGRKQVNRTMLVGVIKKLIDPRPAVYHVYLVVTVLTIGSTLSRYQRKKYRQVQGKIFSQLEKYADGRGISASALLRACAAIYYTSITESPDETS